MVHSYTYSSSSLAARTGVKVIIRTRTNITHGNIESQNKIQHLIITKIYANVMEKLKILENVRYGKKLKLFYFLI